MDHSGQTPLVHAATNGQLDALSFLLQCDWTSCMDRRPTRNEALQQALIAASSMGHVKVMSTPRLIEKWWPCSLSNALKVSCTGRRLINVSTLPNRKAKEPKENRVSFYTHFHVFICFHHCVIKLRITRLIILIFHLPHHCPINPFSSQCTTRYTLSPKTSGTQETIYWEILKWSKSNLCAHHAYIIFLFQICDFLLQLHDVAGEGFGIDMTDTLMGETGEIIIIANILHPSCHYRFYFLCLHIGLETVFMQPINEYRQSRGWRVYNLDENNKHILYFFSALTAACQSGLHEVVILLLDRGASIQATNNRGMPPLLCAARAGMYRTL